MLAEDIGDFQPMFFHHRRPPSLARSIGLSWSASKGPRVAWSRLEREAKIQGGGLNTGMPEQDLNETEPADIQTCLRDKLESIHDDVGMILHSCQSAL